MAKVTQHIDLKVPRETFMKWYCIQTKVKQEQSTENAFLSRGYNVYLPRTIRDMRKHQRGAEHVNIIEPLFPRYLFIQLQEGQDDFHPVSKVPGVVSIVKMSVHQGVMHPTAVPEWVIEGLKLQEDEQGVHMVDHDYKQDDHVRIRQGVFENYEGLVKLPPDKRAMVLLEIMGREVEVPRHHLELVE